MRNYPRQNQARSNNGRSDNKRQEAPRDHSKQQNGRGNPRELHQKYLALAREAIQSGDIIEAEQHFQHAEHYYRVISERNAYNHPPQVSIPKPVENKPESAPAGAIVEPTFQSPSMEVSPIQPITYN